jgi:hypothetical protein
MKRCPACNSRRYRGDQRVGYKCFRCSFDNYPKDLLKTVQKANNDGVIIDSSIPSQTIMNSPLFQEIHDYHGNAWKFRIKRDNPNLNLSRQKGFKGNWYIIPYKFLKIRKSSKWLVIYKEGKNKVPLKNLDKTALHIIEGLKNTALKIAEKYRFEIEPIPLNFSKNHPEVKTPFLSANNFYEDEAKAVYPPPGPIELQGPDAIKNAINLTTLLVDFKDVMEREIRNKQLHQSVLNDMSDTLKQIQESLRSKSFFEKIKGWYSNG